MSNLQRANDVALLMQHLNAEYYRLLKKGGGGGVKTHLLHNSNILYLKHLIA